MKRNIFLLLIAALITSCAKLPVLSEAKDQLETAKVCCAKLEDIKYDNLLINTNKEFSLNRHSQAYNFDTGKSFFTAFEIPKINIPTTFTVKSYFSGDIFFPVITILDKKHNIIKTVNYPEINYMAPTWFESARIEGSVTLEPSSQAKYILIHTTKTLIGKPIQIQGMGTGLLIGGTYTYTPGSVSTYYFTTMGNLKISLLEKNKG